MDKTVLRERLRALGPISPETSRVVSEHLARWLSGRLPQTISAYVAMSDEVDVTSLLERLPGWRWVLPRVERDDTLTFRDRALPLETHVYGMDQPIDSGEVIPVHEIDVFMVPGLGFDRFGGRLGRGRGFYDRALATARGDSISIGVTVDGRVVDSIPMTPDDVTVDMLVTEGGVISCSPRR